MLDTLVHLDRQLFFLINGEWHTPWLDVVLPFARNPYFWAPLYLFLFLFFSLNYKIKGGWWIFFFLVTFGLTDSITGNILKDLVVRYRPCNDPVMSNFTRSLVPCAGSHCFPSNHAANHFALAMFMFLTLRKVFGSWMWIAFLWAFLVCYAQVYVGQHYPADILYGTIVGLIFGSLTGKFFNYKIGLDSA